MKLFETTFGSQVYGIATPASDVDIGVVTMESPSHIFGVQKLIDFPQRKDGQNNDIREFWLKRFVLLCVRGNPNVLEWLYTPEEHIRYCHPLFRKHIIENATIFLDMDKCVGSHLGFAKSQVMKMRNHESEMGAKRRELYFKYGYDVKYASHAIRLIYQLTSLLTDGTIELPYDEFVCAELLSIKVGGVSLKEFDELYNYRVKVVEELIEEARPLFHEWKPNHKTIARILETIYQEGWKE